MLLSMSLALDILFINFFLKKKKNKNKLIIKHHFILTYNVNNNIVFDSYL